MSNISRTCKEIRKDAQSIPSRPLADYRETAAYVLLAPPGAGKTTEFEKEAEEIPDALCVTARDFITLEDENWSQKTLFIDGLDEVRAGVSDPRKPFDKIRQKLKKLSPPRFRLSCREADWFGAGDQEDLMKVSHDGQVTVLHLDPLTERDVLDILSGDSRIADPEGFIREAEKRDLDELLINPQILEMLVYAVTGDHWPVSRKQTFELACRKIIEEHNREHHHASRNHAVNVDTQLTAAGYLCVLQLIAGHEGFALAPKESDDNFPYLNEMPDLGNVQLLRSVLHTKLFKAPAQERVVPIHRQVAEFLAARYLTEWIGRSGLPITRLFSLISGEDNMVVSELRGLSAWLATLCPRNRFAIIDRDPLGTILYGDVHDFNTQEKLHVFKCLQRLSEGHARYLYSERFNASLGGLATKDMEEKFLEILTATERSPANQVMAEFVLSAALYGYQSLQLDNVLPCIIRDSSWHSFVRARALQVLIHWSSTQDLFKDMLSQLLNEIKSGMVSDPDDDLLGYLLKALYPDLIPPDKVFDYLHAPTYSNYIGRYLMFWNLNLLAQSSDSDIAILLDELSARKNSIQQLFEDHHFNRMPGRLLARGIEVHGENLDLERLYRWLGVCLDRSGFPIIDADEKEKIKKWFTDHPKIQKDLIAHGIDKCRHEEKLSVCMVYEKHRLFDAHPPHDLGQWLLDWAQKEQNENVAKYLFQSAVSTLWGQGGNTGLDLEIIENLASQEKRFYEWLIEISSCEVPVETLRIIEDQKSKQENNKQAWFRAIKEKEDELRQGQAPPRIMHDLGCAYFGYLIEAQGDTPIERLHTTLKGDEILVQAALEGLRQLVHRDDLPSAKDIIGVALENKRYFFSIPFIAGLDLVTQSSSEEILQLDDDNLRRAIAFHLTEGSGEDPSWYEELLRSKPEIIAEILSNYAIKAVHGNKNHIMGLYGLAYCNKYLEIARIASLNILKAFPVRCSNKQLENLDYLLKAAIQYVDHYQLLKLTEEKLKLRSMNVGQKVRWLACGLITDPEQYGERIKNFAGKSKNRILNLTAFLADRHDRSLFISELPASTLGLLIELIGTYISPPENRKNGRILKTMSSGYIVNHMANILSSHPTEEASEILYALLQKDELRDWYLFLNEARNRQKEIRREASFRHPDIKQIINTLNNQSPANAADLCALTEEILKEIAQRIRHGNTDDYRQYWNEEPSRRKLSEPKHEDACRDALLSDLQQRLRPLDVDANPEGHYADDKRSDIRVSYGGITGFNVPIEIKKNSHRDIWTAMHDQLIALYTRDPGAFGYGIYLVFWFGAERTPKSPGRKLPNTPEEMKQALENLLSAEESTKITVLVIDASAPG